MLRAARVLVCPGSGSSPGLATLSALASALVTVVSCRQLVPPELGGYRVRETVVTWSCSEEHEQQHHVQHIQRSTDETS